MKRSNFLYAILLVILITGGVYAYVYLSATRALGTLEIFSTPPGAQVYVNDTAKGETPLLLDSVPLGLKEVALKREGYDNYSRILHFHPQQRISLSIHLSRADFPLENLLHLSGSLPRGHLEGEDSLYLFSTAGELLSFHLETSRIQWQQDFDTIALSLPRYAQGEVFAATFFGTLYTLTSETGEIIRQVETGKGIQKMVNWMDTLYLLHTDGSLSAWAGDEPTWTFTGQGKVQDLFLDEKLILLLPDTLLFLNLSSGRLEKELELPFHDVKALALSLDTLYLTKKGVLYRVDLQRGVFLEEQKTGLLGDIAAMAQEGETLFFGTDKGEVLAIQRGNVLWEADLGESVTSLYPQTSLLIGTEQRSLYFLDKETGSYQARKALPSQLTGLYSHEDGYYLIFRDGSLALLTRGNL